MVKIYDTGNPVPSGNPKDFNDNSVTIDGVVNSNDECIYNRVGNKLLTMFGISEMSRRRIELFDAEIDLIIKNAGGVVVENSLGNFIDRPISQFFITKYMSYNVTLDMFGGVNDGLTDSTQAMIDALASGRNVYIPKGEGYVISNKSFELRNQKIFGDGVESKIIMNTDSSLNRNGFDLFSNSSISDLYINRKATSASQDGSFNNIVNIGRYHNPNGDLTSNVKIINLHLNNESTPQVGRLTVSGIYGNVRDVEIENITYSGNISYALMIHWGGDFDPSSAQSDVAKSWHPRNIKIDGIDATQSSTDGGLGVIYLSAIHDIEIDNIKCNNFRNPITIGCGDVGGNVSQDESVDRVLKNINLRNLNFKRFVGSSGLTISGLSGKRAGRRWSAIDHGCDISVDGLEVGRSDLLQANYHVDISFVDGVDIVNLKVLEDSGVNINSNVNSINLSNSKNVNIHGSGISNRAVISSFSSDINLDLDFENKSNEVAQAHLGIDLVNTVRDIDILSVGGDKINVLPLGYYIPVGAIIEVNESENVEVSRTYNPEDDYILINKNITTSETNIKAYCESSHFIKARLNGYYNSVRTSPASMYDDIKIELRSNQCKTTDVQLYNVSRSSISGIFTDGNSINSDSSANIKIHDGCNFVVVKEDSIFEQETSRVMNNITLSSGSNYCSVRGIFVGSTGTRISNSSSTSKVDEAIIVS